MYRPLVLAVFAAPLLAACALEPSSESITPSVNCDRDREAWISVQNNQPLAVPEEIRVCRGGVRITWGVTTPGCTFDAAEGIKFKQPAAPYQNCMRNPADPRFFSCVNAAAHQRGTYPYGIKLLCPQPVTYDPNVVNE